MAELSAAPSAGRLNNTERFFKRKRNNMKTSARNQFAG
ncbi:MAG: transporter, partial [Neisseria sp.]